MILLSLAMYIVPINPVLGQNKKLSRKYINKTGAEIKIELVPVPKGASLNSGWLRQNKSWPISVVDGVYAFKIHFKEGFTKNLGQEKLSRTRGTMEFRRQSRENSFVMGDIQVEMVPENELFVLSPTTKKPVLMEIYDVVTLKNESDKPIKFSYYKKKSYTLKSGFEVWFPFHPVTGNNSSMEVCFHSGSKQRKYKLTTNRVSLGKGFQPTSEHGKQYVFRSVKRNKEVDLFQLQSHAR